MGAFEEYILTYAIEADPIEVEADAEPNSGEPIGYPIIQLSNSPVTEAEVNPIPSRPQPLKYVLLPMAKSKPSQNQTRLILPRPPSEGHKPNIYNHATPGSSRSSNKMV